MMLCTCIIIWSYYSNLHKQRGCLLNLTNTIYLWIGYGVQSGLTLVFSLSMSDLETKTSFGFLIDIENYRDRFFEFS